jgi:hypothetical protein
VAERGLAVVAIAALCHHNSRGTDLPEAYFASAEVFARKWKHRLPVAAPCVIFDRARGEARWHAVQSGFSPQTDAGRRR